MDIRKRLRSHPEIHNGALNDILFILLLFFLIVSTLANPNVVKVNNPRGKSDTKAKQTIVVSINKDQQIFVGQQAVGNYALLDSLLKLEITQAKSFTDTPSVVINSDTLAHYGEVFRIMQAAKKAGAKVVANVK